MTALPAHASIAGQSGRRRFVGVLVSVAVAVAAFTGLASAAPAAASTGSAEAGFVAGINAARADVGRPSYGVSNELTLVARRWAQNMAASNGLRHNPNLAGQVTGWRYVGENVGVGSDVSGLHRAFMNSPGHKANIVDNDFTQLGVGVAYGGGRLWVAEVFRKPTMSAAASPSRLRPATRTFRIGSRGTVVKRIQLRVRVRADGKYGPITAAAVKRWQRAHKMKVTGMVTPAVRRAMRV